MVEIRGAEGDNAAYINGFFEPTSEVVGHASVYRKVGDADVWVEYHEPSGMWIVKSTSDRGKGAGMATATISPPKPLEQCPLSCWQVYDGTNWVKQSSLRVAATTMAAFEAFEAAKVMYMVLIVYICTNVYYYYYCCYYHYYYF